MGTGARRFSYEDGTYLQEARLHGTEVLLDRIEVAVAVMDRLCVECRLRYVRLQHVTALELGRLSLSSGIHRGRELSLVQGDLHERGQLVPLDPGAEGLA